MEQVISPDLIDVFLACASVSCLNLFPRFTFAPCWKITWQVTTAQLMDGNRSTGPAQRLYCSDHCN